MNLLRFIAHFSITFFFSFVICAIEVVSFPTARRAYTRVEGGGQDFFLVFSKTFFRLTLPRFTRALQKLRFPAFHANLRHTAPPRHKAHSPCPVTRSYGGARPTAFGCSSGFHSGFPAPPPPPPASERYAAIRANCPDDFVARFFSAQTALKKFVAKPKKPTIPPQNAVLH